MIVFFFAVKLYRKSVFLFFVFPPTFLSGILIIRLHIDIEG